MFVGGDPDSRLECPHCGFVNSIEPQDHPRPQFREKAPASNIRPSPTCARCTKTITVYDLRRGR